MILSMTILPKGLPNDLAATSARLSPRTFATLKQKGKDQQEERRLWTPGQGAEVAIVELCECFTGKSTEMIITSGING